MQLKRYKRVSIIVPVFNEAKTIKQLLTAIVRANILTLKKEVIVVDDASADNSRQIIETVSKKHKNIQFYFHKKNRGKGAAFNTALKYAKGDIIVIQDADLEYPPRNIASLIKPIISQNASVVFGSRKLRKEKHYSSFLYYIGGAMIDLLIKKSLGIKVSDAICGPKAFEYNILKKLGKIESRGFEIDTELTAKFAKKNIAIYEVPIIYRPRTIREGKKIRWYDAFKILWMLLKLRLAKKPQF